MICTKVAVLRVTALFLLVGALAAQWAGMSQFQKLVNGANGPVIMQADGPLPPPPPTPIKSGYNS